jgi:hypothetical protein
LTRNIFCLFFISVSFVLHAQVIQNGRMEIPIVSNVESYAAISLDTAGIALYRSFIGNKENVVEIVRVDTSLHQVWKGFLPVPKGLSIVSTKTADHRIFFFFESKMPASKRFFHVIVVQVNNGAYTAYPIKNIITFNATDFVASKDVLLIGGYFNFRPMVLHYSTKDQRSRLLPGFLNEPGEITQIKTYEDGNIDVIVSAKNSARKKCLWIRHFDNAGDLIKTVVLEPEENKNLIFGRAAKMDNDNQVIAGVYGKSSEYSRGIFVAEVSPFGEYVIRYYNFADLQNFFHYMKANREKRIKERIERRRVKGKKIKFNYRFLVHELIPYGNQFVMLGEAFYPTYSNRFNLYNTQLPSNPSPWSYGISNRVAYSSSSPYRSDVVFDGFQYTHAIVIGFDAQAKLSWDNSFEINGLKSYQLEQFVKILPEKDKIALIYLYANAIRSKVINNNQVLEGTMQDPIRTADQKSLNSSVQSSKLEYWYANHLFVYGVQDIVDNQEVSHKVFFINKLSPP